MTPAHTLPLHPASLDPRTEQRLRRFDLGLAALALPLLALPLALAAGMGRWQHETHIGAEGRTFERRRLVMPDHLLGRWFNRLGATRWPDLLHILSGDMAWVGPRPHRAQASLPAPAVRPGVVNSWQLRRRTAIDFDGEQAADLEDLRQRSPRYHLGVLLRSAFTAWLGAPAETTPQKVRLCDVVFDNVNMGEALQRIEQMLDGNTTQQVCFVNPACVNIAATHRGYRRTLARAALVLPDGIGTKIAGSMLGTPLKQNVNGTDLFPRLCEILARRQTRIFLLGGQVGVAERVAEEVQRRWPGIEVVGLRDGFFTVVEEGAVAEQVRASGADVLFVARGVPAQDLLVDRHLAALGVKAAIGVGGLFDFISGRINRAPLWMREMGLEWSYRLLQEPARMWRRYLVGNFTFLARIALQRVGLRPPAADIEEPRRLSAPAVIDTQSTRAVLFAASAASPDVPVPAGFPAALLPLGHASVIERQIAQLARAGVKDVDVVLCHGPELMRERLDDGRPLGVRIHWHLVKDPDRPYAILGTPALQAVHRVLVGHADAWVPDHVVRALAERDQWVAVPDETGAAMWGSWLSAAPSQLARMNLAGERRSIAAQLQGASMRALEAGAAQCVVRLDAAGLLRAQQLVQQKGDRPAVPSSWLRTPWGACSPEAFVHPEARIEGPALIGPGCVVQAGATLGANTWLSRDVVVSGNTSLADSLVLPGTFIGAGLEFSNAIVNGGRVRHLAHGVETVLRPADGLLSSLQSSGQARSSVTGRLLAAVVLATLAPIALPTLAARAARGHALPWVKRPIVLGREETRPGLASVALRCVHGDATGGERALAGYGALADVAMGRRAWFGMRPRTAAQWYALSADWQHLLSRVPVGLVHQPAWADVDTTRAEAEAAADVFHAIRRGPGERMRLVIAATTRWLSRERQQPLDRPVWHPRSQGQPR
jgi:N-acetylglucosaminyldiphosphoundecaprenol N-acetyl-beta-D-mannosaminyltransferase